MNPVILTADDPEPPESSVVLDETGIAWQSDGDFWRSTSSDFLRWSNMECLGTLTLIHRGPDPDSGDPRAAGEEFLQSVRAAVEEFLRLDPAEREKHLLARAPRCYLCSVRPVSYDGGLCGDCTDSLTKLKDTFAAQIESHQC